MPEEKKTNHQILHDNKEKLLDYVQGYINSSNTTDSIEVKPIDGIQELFDKGNYSSAIMLLDERKDNKVGIRWDRKEDLGNATGVLVRDARGQTQEQKQILEQKELPEKYAMQLINQLRGGIDLINIDDSVENKEPQIAKLKFIVKEALNNLDNLDDKRIKEYNTKMLSVLEDAGVEKAAERLQIAKELSNIKDTHYHISTLSKVQDSEGKEHTAVEAELMLNGLTEKQKKHYESISKYKPLQNSYTGVGWFDSISDPVKKHLISMQASEIAKGNKVIPAQLLSDVEGVRNGYMKVTSVSSDKNITIVSEDIHCGAPAVKIKTVPKKEQHDLVAENIRQLQTFIQEDKKINLNSFNSKTPSDVRGEDFIINQINEAKNHLTNSATATTSPINKWRWLGGGRKQKAFAEDLSSLGEALSGHDDYKVSLPNTSKYLQRGSNSRFGKLLETITFGAYKTMETKARNELRGLDESDKKLASILETAINTKKLINTPILSAKSENANLEISDNMSAIENAAKLESGALNELINKIGINIHFCKSGKDRTGEVMRNISGSAINRFLGVEPNSEVARQNKDSMAYAGHTQEMAGIQGGSIGCHSLKTNPEFGLNKSEQHLSKVLSNKSSHFNSKIKVVKDEKQKQRIVEQFNSNYVQQQTVEKSKIDQETKKAAAQMVDESKAQGHENSPGDNVETTKKRQDIISSHRQR